MDAKDKQRIFELRKSYIERFHSWDERIFYGFLIICGSAIISIFANLDSLINKVNVPILLLFVFLIVGISLALLEIIALFQSNRRYLKLIEDIKRDKIEDFRKLDLIDYIMGRV